MDLPKGTVLEIRHKSRPYTHWAILDGEGGVCHVNKKLGKITLDPLEKVLRNAVSMSVIDEDSETRQHNWERASAQIDMPYSYGLLTNNCDTWVNEIRFGDSTSKQVEKVANYLTLLSLFLL